MPVHFIKRLSAAVAVALALCPLSGTGSAAAEDLRIGGTGAAVAVMTHLSAAFAAGEPGIGVQVLPSLGSSGSIRALAEGAIDIAVSARPLKAKEAAQGLQAVPLLRTPFVLVTSLSKPPALAGDSLAALYADAGATWPDGSPVHIVLRPESDSDSTFLAEHFAGMPEALASAHARPEVPLAATDQDNIRLASEIPGSLTSATLVQVVSEFAPVRIITLDGVEPSVEAMLAGRYAFFKELILVHRGDADGRVARFIAFLGSDEGRRLLREAGGQPLL